MAGDDDDGQPGSRPVRVSVVMPAHQEQDYLEPAVRTVAEGLRRRGLPFEVVVVENGSTDKTREIAEGLARELPEVTLVALGRADYGAALRAGFLASSGEAVASFDVDYYDLDFLDQTLVLLDGGADLVIGSKRAPGADDRRAWPRRLVTGVFVTALQKGFGLEASDTHGMKVGRRHRLLPLVEACRLGTDLFDTELVLRAERCGLRLVEVGVDVEEHRPPRTSIARRSARTLFGLVHLHRVLREGAR
ncbi:MAG: glycosyltransferase [Acidimicrobiales bacterium]|jgi:glycosyltransferase involved in cell wall biosynthesis